MTEKAEKRVEFHQANVKIAFRVVDDEKSYGLKTAEFSLLLNTPEEWMAAQELVAQAKKQFEEGINGGNST